EKTKASPEDPGNGKIPEQDEKSDEPGTAEMAEGRSMESGSEENPEAEGLSREDAKREVKAGEFPVAGIGASAGGLPALEAFFGAVPADSGIAYVVITHTDPEHESLLPGLLKKRSKMPVRLIQDGMAAEPDAVYLPPSNRDPLLKGRVFRLQERPGKSEVHMPVDLFLKSLAAECGEAAAGIILSGTGTDGTLGIRLIKERAGLTVAQAPDSARHAGMPNSAIGSGLVDYVLPPREMPERLVQYFKHPAAFRKEPGKEGKKEPDPLHLILAFLNKHTRQDFSLYKENTLVRRIERRMTVIRARDASDYLKLLNENPHEARTLFQELLIGVTSFFRDPEAFGFLKEQVLPELVSQEDAGPLRVWIPGCSTGEEGYSVAMILQECEEETSSSREVQIYATDIDAEAIRNAREGLYLENISSDVGPERLKRFFLKEGTHYRVKPALREKLVFSEQNILYDPPFSKLDLLVCRNLLIYLKPEAQNRLIPLFHYSLRSGGVLFLGSSESVGRFHDLFPAVNRHYSVFQKKNHLLRPAVDFLPPRMRAARPGLESKEGRALEHPASNV
ncbi:MAG TPA: CheR family methyltransferase, partial [Thermodesulfobacteriota bacterium]|nr:CheR family methyltransferase [Thermodesulfobacteriota bacterium]